MERPIWVHRFAVVAAVATLVLLCLGPLRPGVTHRFASGLELVAAIFLCVFLFVRDPRFGVRFLGLLSFVFSLAFSVKDSLLGLQLALCLQVLLSMMTSPAWSDPALPLREEPKPWLSLRSFCVLTLVCFLGQTILGAVIRYFGIGLAIPDFPQSFGHWFPAVMNWRIALGLGHRVGAALTVLASVGLMFRIFSRHGEWRGLVVPAGLLVVLVFCQFLLGASVVWMRLYPPITNAHLVIGDLCLAVAVALTAQAYRLGNTSFFAETLFQLPLRAPLEAR